MPVEPFITVLPYRFTFRALDPLSFPPGKAANTLRGALGMALRKVSCPSDCKKLGPACGCPYARLFAPRSDSGPSGFADPPRPFVLRAASLEGGSFVEGSLFSFDLHLFTNDHAALLPFAQAFQVFLAEGIGAARGRVELTAIDLLNVAREPTCPVFPATQTDGTADDGVQLSLAAAAEAPRRVTVEFVTPTELKYEGALVERPQFFIVVARLRDRISALSTLYGAGPLEIDHIGIVERARSIELVSSDVSWVSSERRSSRTGQRHPLGGFVGTAIYRGPLGEFMPWLRAGYWTGVGRQTVWGKGVIEIL